MRTSHRTALASVIALIVTLGLGSGALGQAASPAAEPTDPGEAGVPDVFPSAEEISAVLGAEVEARGVQAGLSQLWEGSAVDTEALPGAQLAMYASPAADGQERFTGVIIDVAHFESVDHAVQHVDGVVLGGAPPDFETEVAGDFVTTLSFASDDDTGGSVIILRRGPVAVAVTVAATGATEMEAASEAIVQLVLDRLEGNG